jgi:hypothetical protein
MPDKEKRTRRIGKITITPFPLGSGKHNGFVGAVKNWWWNLTTVFCFRVTAGLSGVQVTLRLLESGFDFDLKLPYFALPLPLVSKLPLDWLAWSHAGKNKGWELQTWYTAHLNAGFDVSATMHTDHFGLFVVIDLLFLHIEFSFYDGRHWDDESNKPEEEGET